MLRKYYKSEHRHVFFVYIALWEIKEIFRQQCTHKLSRKCLQAVFSKVQKKLIFVAQCRLKRTLLHNLIAGKTRCQTTRAELQHKGLLQLELVSKRKEYNYITTNLKGGNKKTHDSSLRDDETRTLTLRRDS